MSSFFSLLPADGWQRLLCDALWQSTLIALLGWLVARCLVRHSAARAWVLLMTLIACAVVPLASMAARANGWTVLPADRDLSPLQSAAVTVTPEEVEQFIQQLSSQPTEPDPSAALVVDSTADPPTAEPRAKIDRPATVKISDRTAAVAAFLPVAAGQTVVRFTGAIALQILAMIWLALSVLLLARLILAIAATRRTLRNAVPCNDAALQAAAAEAARRIGVRCPGVFYSRHVETPTIYALGHPRLLAPQTSLAHARGSGLQIEPQHSNSEPRPSGNVDLDGASIDRVAAFSHELAHVARGDGWARLAVECIRITLPLQPLIWLLRRSFHTASEEACDDWAVATGTNPIDLADTLTAWINRPRRTSSLVAIGMSSTKKRTMRLLRMCKAPNVRLSRSYRGLGVPAVLLLIVGLAIAQSSSREKTTPPRDDSNNAKSSLNAVPEAKTAVSHGNDSPTTDQIDKAIAADSLIALYARRLAQDQAELDQLTKEPNPNFSPDYPNLLREQIDEMKNRLEKRKAYLRPLILKELQEVNTSTQRRQVGTASSRRAGDVPYIIQPRDMLVIETVELVPKKLVRIAPFDQVKIVADPTTTKLENPISGTFQVDSAGDVVLGPAYGAVKISGLTRSEAEEAVLIQLQATLKDPAVSLVIDESRLESGIKGEHLVSADGSITLGAYGSVEVEGLTIAQAREAIAKQLSDFFAAPEIAVQVKSASSKVYYVFSWDGNGGKGTVERVPITGNDTVLDAIAHLKAGIEFTGAKLFIQRLSGGDKTEVIEVDLDHVLEGTAANRQILPGDRIFVNRRPPAAQVIPQTPAGKSVPRPTERKDAEKLHSLLPSDGPPKAWAETNPAPFPPYEIEPPDILLIDALRLAPKEPYTIQPLDILKVEADPNSTALDDRLYGPRLVEPGGMLNLGPRYGKVKVSGLSLEEAGEKVLALLQKVYKSPKVSVTLSESGGQQQIAGEHLVGPDGTINLGTYGQVYVSQLTIPEAKDAIEKKLGEVFEKPKVSVDIYAYNSKVYYVISKGSGFGDNIMRFPATGNETVLDAISQVKGLTRLSDAKVWIQRPKSRYSSVEKKLEVKWDEIGASSNYQILPGDRIYIDRPLSREEAKQVDAELKALPDKTNF